jgi:hypothetical protein
LAPRYRGRGKYARPVDQDKADPYLLDIRVSQGAPFIHAKTDDGRTITIARRFFAKGGELLVFFQAKMWGNDSFGTMRDEPRHDAAYGSHDLQMAFARWLAEEPPVLEGKVAPEPAPDAGVAEAADDAEKADAEKPADVKSP